MGIIKYKSGYKYQLNETYQIQISIVPDEDIHCVGGYVSLTTEGVLTIKKGYAWDGPSGPTRDTLNFMRGSLVHDALYQLMRNELLSAEKYRDESDRLLQKMCRQDGMNPLRAWLVYWVLRVGGKGATLKKNMKKIIHAPKV